MGRAGRCPPGGGGGVGRWPPGAGGRGRSGAGAGGGAAAAGRGASPSGRRGGGCSLPDDVTRRDGGAGGVVGIGRPAPGRGGGTRGPDAAGLTGRSAAGASSPDGAGGAAAGRCAGSSAEGAGAATSRAGAEVSASAASPRAARVAGRLSRAVASAAALACALGAAGAPADLPLAAFSPLPPAASGCCERTRPSRSARRRTRSACASSIPEECVLTPMPNDRQRSRHSLFVSPSSLASSWTLVFAAKFSLTSPSSFPGRDPRS